MNTKEMKSKTLKRTVFILVTGVLFFSLLVSGYFFYKYLFPTDKELFLIAHKNTLELLVNEPENFKKTKNISFLTETLNGEFVEDNEKEISPLSFDIDGTEYRGNSEYNISVNLNEKDILKSTKVEIDDTEVLTIPKLSDKNLASDSYEEILSLLLGDDVYKNIDISERIDEEQFKKYLLKYSKKIYENIPEESFVLTKSGTVKQIKLNVNLSDAVHGVLEEIKEDLAFREFMYEQNKALAENINKKYPYTTEFIKVADKEEYFKNFNQRIDEFIKKTKNSTVRVQTLIDDKRVILEENMTVEDEKYEQLTLYYSEKAFSTVYYDKYDTVFSLYSKKELNGSKTSEKTQVSFNITENREQGINPQKMFRMIVESTTDTDGLKEIVLPDKYFNIKDMSAEEKNEIRRTAKERLNSIISEVMSEFIK